METKDVLLLVAGSVLGYLMSLLATFSAPPLSGAFGKLKSGWIERNKAMALANYIVVRDLKSGAWDKYLYALNSWGFVIVYLVFCATGTTLGLLHSDPAIRLVGGFIAGGGLARSLRRLDYLITSLRRVKNFDEYRAELLRRWPDLVLPE